MQADVLSVQASRSPEFGVSGIRVIWRGCVSHEPAMCLRGPYQRLLRPGCKSSVLITSELNLAEHEGGAEGRRESAALKAAWLLDAAKGDSSRLISFTVPENRPSRCSD